MLKEKYFIKLKLSFFSFFPQCLFYMTFHSLRASRRCCLSPARKTLPVRSAVDETVLIKKNGLPTQTDRQTLLCATEHQKSEQIIKR